MNSYDLKPGDTVCGIAVGDTVVCNTSFGGRNTPVKGKTYEVAKFTQTAGRYFLWPKGFEDGWDVKNFTKTNTALKVGDIVLCVDHATTYPPLLPSVPYKVLEVGGDFVMLDGFMGRYYSRRFVKYQNPCAEIPVASMVDWKSSYEAAKRAEKAAQADLDAALAREKTLRKEVETTRFDLNRAQESVKILRQSFADEREVTNALSGALAPFRHYGEHIVAAAKRLVADSTKVRFDGGYVKELEDFRQKIHSLVERKPNGESGAEAVQRIADEHKRMKRQLELAESYNFDRKGLSDNEVIRDLYNYALVGLGKKPLDLYEWLRQRIKSALANSVKTEPRKTAVSDAFQRYVWSEKPVAAMAKSIEKEIDDFVLTSIKQTARGFDIVGHHKCSLDFIPITFTDEKPSHQSDAYSPTGCGSDCSHPDCKKANK